MFVKYGSQDRNNRKDEFIWNLVDEIRLKNIDSLDKIIFVNVYYKSS